MLRATFLAGLIRASVLSPSTNAPATPMPQDTPRPDPLVDRFFASAKIAWRARQDPPYVRYALAETYEWHDQKQLHTWTATLRVSDRRLSLVRQPDAGGARPDAFTVLDPPILANGSFGFVEPTHLKDGKIVPTVAATRSPGRLSEIARTEAFVRDYVMENLGIENLGGELVQHLLLVPRRDPAVNRLRDLWVTPTDESLRQLSIQGLFLEAPYDGVRWLIRYALVDGRPYVRKIYTVEDLNFNGQTVRFLTFSCSDFTFPATVPPETFG